MGEAEDREEVDWDYKERRSTSRGAQRQKRLEKERGQISRVKSWNQKERQKRKKHQWMKESEKKAD